MAVISVSIIESSDQIVSGIPRSVAIETNTPSTIFYTLDGSDPTLFSSIYTTPLLLPTSDLSVNLKVLATNGTDYSPIVSEIYTTSIKFLRTAHAATTAVPNSELSSKYPYGTNPLEPNGDYLSTGDAGITVNNEDLPSTPTAFDADGNDAAFTNNPYDIENYSILYSTTDYQNVPKPGVGNLPGTVTVQQPVPEPEYSSQFTKTFDPRAFVIFQDFEQEDPNDPPQINKQFFTLEDSNARDGNKYYTSGLDAPPVNGSFLRSHYNPRDNTITYYYLDTWTNKWIISKTPYKPTGSFDGNLAGTRVSGKNGAGIVFEWLPFTRRVLF